MSIATDSKVIAHCVSPYLFAAGSWVYGQLVNMKRYKPIVLTATTENLDIFPFSPVYSYGDLSMIQKVLIRLRNDGFNDVYHNFFYGALRKYHAALMHCHFGTCGVGFLEVKKRLGIPMVTTFYGSDMSFVPRNRAWREKYHALFREGECFLAEGRHMRDRLLELGCDEKKVTVQHLGVDLKGLPLLVRRTRADGTVHILVAAAFREKKGIPYALEAFARVRQKHKDISLTLVGGSTGEPRDEREKRRILELLAKHEFHGAVRQLGYQPYPVFRELLTTHHLLLSPSVTAEDGDSEGGSPVCITEAQATGMPVVSTLHADIPEVVLHGKTGLLSPERNVETLAANLEYLVTHGDLWEAMGHHGRDHVEKEYDMVAQGRKLEEIYSNILCS